MYEDFHYSESADEHVDEPDGLSAPWMLAILALLVAVVAIGFTTISDGASPQPRKSGPAGLADLKPAEDPPPAAPDLPDASARPTPDAVPAGFEMGD